MPWLIFTAWRYGGEDPWRLYNDLDGDYRPLADPERPAVRPKYPVRVRHFVYACGAVAAMIEGKVKDTRPSVTQRQRIRDRRMPGAPR